MQSGNSHAKENTVSHEYPLGDENLQRVREEKDLDDCTQG